jgi:hypothetical protein
MSEGMSEVQRVLEKMRVEKARKRNERKKYRNTEPRLVLTEAEKERMIKNNKAASREGKEDCMEWIKLKEMQKGKKVGLVV